MEELVYSIVIILLMLLLSAFFSGMEIAFNSKNRLRLEIDRKQSHLFDSIASVFARHPAQYITTILIGNNIALVVYSLSMSILLKQIVLSLGWVELSESGSVLLETVISTLIIIFVAEFLPKSIFRNNPNFYYRIFSPIIYLFYLILYPIARLTKMLSHLILRIFGRKIEEQEGSEVFDKTDLASLLEQNTPDTIGETDNEIKLFQKALDFSDLRVRDGMIPRVDIEAVSLDDTSIEELTARFVETKYSRIFVYKDSIDNIIGYVKSMNLFSQPQSIRDVIKRVNFVPETMPLQQLMESLIAHKSNIAVVIDEFGGTAGIISLEDILEQIFGEIEDEHDTTDMIEKVINENEYLLSCRLEIDYLNEKYQLAIPASKEYDTLAGFVIFNHEGLPNMGETIVANGLEITIVKSEGSRLLLSRVKKIE